MKFKVFYLLSILTYFFIQTPLRSFAQKDSAPPMCAAVFYYLNHKIPMDLQKVEDQYAQGISIDKATDASWGYSENAKIPSFRDYIEIAFQKDPHLKEYAQSYYELQKQSQSMRYQKFWNWWEKNHLPVTKKRKVHLEKVNSANLILDYVEWSIENTDKHLENIHPAVLREKAVMRSLAKIIYIVHQIKDPEKKKQLPDLIEQSKDMEYRKEAYLEDLSQLWEREDKVLWEKIKKEIGPNLVGDDYLAMTIGSAFQKSIFFDVFRLYFLYAESLDKMNLLYRRFYKEIPKIIHEEEKKTEDLLKELILSLEKDRI